MKAAAVVLLALATGPVAAACPTAGEVRQEDMLGRWHAQIETHGSATLLLQRNPEFGGSFSGTVERKGQRARVAGDIDQGEFTLEESIDGVRVSATWIGQVVEASCGREVRGTWQADGDDAPILPFFLKKQ
jgi:hypothetical protein